MIAPEVLRSKISSVQQTSFLFNTSIMENIHLGRLSSNLDDIHIPDLVSQHGYQHALAETVVNQIKIVQQNIQSLLQRAAQHFFS